jgi:hypothetical protein
MNLDKSDSTVAGIELLFKRQLNAGNSPFGVCRRLGCAKREV